MSTSHPIVTAITAHLPDIERAPDRFELAAVDLYKDIHKGIRSELFAITTGAANIDPAARLDRISIADHVASVSGVLASHAHHEDAVIDPVLAEHHPDLAERVNADHEVLETRFDELVDLSRSAVDAVTPDQRRLVHLLHLELSAFTSAYLAHQYLEERVVMPAIERSIGPAAVVELHEAIVSSIPPEEMARSLAFMLPAMNVDDRVEMLLGIQASAPAPAFASVVDLARSVLHEADMASLSSRMVLS